MNHLFFIQVEEDVPECETVMEKKCKDTSSGYVTSQDCKEWPRQVCSLTKKSVDKVAPETRCDKIPRVVCGPKGCGYSEGPEECHDKVKTVIFDHPEEVCKLDPRKSCKFVTKLVPQLKRVENCIDVPKEICVRAEKNPRKVKYPVIRNWCYSLKCPEACVEAAKNGLCLTECAHYKDKSCCAPSKCSSKCSEAAKWGECPSECKKHSGDPACCAPKCPAKCSNKLQGQCSAKGVQECGNIPGCCPDKFTLVFGDVTFGEEPIGTVSGGYGTV